MMADTQPWELSALRGLQSSYEARGLRFVIDPPRELLPGFLAGHTPDAIAVGPDGGGVVLEILRPSSRAGGRQDILDIAKKVAEQKGWEFRAVYASPASELPDTIAQPTPEQIDARLGEVRVLADAGHYAPALVAGWAVLEALARLARGPGSSKAFSPLQAVQALAEEGYLESEDARRLREMARLRSAVVHGDFAVDVSAEQVEFLLDQLTALKLGIAEVAAEAAGE
jgi:uncharacterized protein YutE (UPF0331/DUF86 family)